MHMDRRTYTKHGLPRSMDHPCGPTILDKSPWDSAAIFIFFCYFSFPLKTMHPFQNFLAVLPPPTLYKVETLKKFWIHTPNIV